MTPAMVRPFSDVADAVSVLRMASTGSTAPARRDGASADTTVTTVPSKTGTNTAVGLRPRPLSMGMPWPRMMALMAATSPTPARTPTREPMMPTMMDSPITERVIWLRDAPSARSSANSLVRWATIIEKVLAMINVPTSRAMRPNATKK